MLERPLAEKMRPNSLDEVIGHDKITGKDGILRKIINSKKPTSLIFWGPAGIGKTTLARILANELNANFIELSAVTAKKQDVTDVIKQARINWNLNIRTILFVDEIHRFNKAQQDSFLPHVESGLITLIGATTENPSFEVIPPLLSRARVIVLDKLKNEDLEKIIENAYKKAKEKNKKIKINKEAITLMADLASGDARVALGNLELILNLNSNITKETILKTLQKKLPRYDKSGDNHYDIISAFIKSMRGSDTNATLYYLARMLDAGEDPKFIARRMIIFASEDIGLAGNGALSLAVSCFNAIEKIGMPEAKYIIYHTAVALSLSKKSRKTTEAMYKAESLAKEYPNLEVPLHIRNGATKLMKNLGYGKDYKWESDFKHPKGYLPEEIKDISIFD